jgi:hypothetical protein
LLSSSDSHYHIPFSKITISILKGSVLKIIGVLENDTKRDPTRVVGWDIESK